MTKVLHKVFNVKNNYNKLLGLNLINQNYMICVIGQTVETTSANSKVFCE